MVPHGVNIGLKISSEARDLSHLAAIGPDDLQVIDAFYISYPPRNVDAQLAFLQGLTGLQALNLSMNHLSGDGLSYIKGLTSLQVLDVSINNISDGGLVHIGDMTSLRWLNLFVNDIEGWGLSYLHRLSSLRLLVHGLSTENTRLLGQILPDCEDGSC
jgi:hypothetical protein